MDTERNTGSWRDFRQHAEVATVLAGGVLVGAITIYLAASLLPTAVEDIGGERLYAWNTTVFLVAQVVGTLVVNRLLAGRGAVGSYLIGFGVFAAGSLVCAVSPMMPVLLIGRGVQGWGAGLLTGLGFASVHSALPRALWVRGSALISAMFGVGNFVGPALGGVFAQFGSWRAAFAVLAVVAVMIAAVVPRSLPKGQRLQGKSPVPVAAVGLVVAAAAAVSVAAVVPGAVAMTVSLVVAVAAVVVFVVVEKGAEQRILPAATYRGGSPLRWIYATIMLLASGVAVETFLPLFGQRMGGLPPIAAGFFGAALSLGWSASQIVVSSVRRDRTIRLLRIAGPALLAAGFAVLAVLQRDHASLPMVLAWLPVLLIAGAGIGIAMPHLSVAAMTSTADPEEGRTAAAAIATVLTVSTAFGAAVAGLLVNVGGPGMAASARWLLVGFAVIAALAIPTAVRTNRSARVPDDRRETVQA
ncbi:MFS transporter [Nocardia transvalensis]|uniref:MFS transporter n=1 Tax=Nocardia transvalensis TaxID=37333 RepID=UPI001894C83E|nr:MFS transporter [Nocardia transvalensis]MBF6327339.1 MFS transporter [Nocardia transvalensis]